MKDSEMQEEDIQKIRGYFQKVYVSTFKNYMTWTQFLCKAKLTKPVTKNRKCKYS